MITGTELLSQRELREIDRATRELLCKVGVSVAHEEALEIYGRAGASIDSDRQIVKLPDHLIDDALGKCSPQVRLHGRNGTTPLEIGGERTYFGTTGFATHILDMESGKYRPSLSQDLVEAFRLEDVLETPHFIMSSLTPTDVPPEVSDLHEFKIGLTNTRKHIIAQAQGAEHLRKVTAMAVEVAGSLEALQDRPFFSVMVCLTSPLIIRPDAAELIIEGAGKGLPLFIEAGPMCGATAPATLASTLVCANAELICSLVLAKLVNPEVPLVYASWARIFDMKSAVVSHGGPEFGLLRMATTRMAKYYKLPSGGGGVLADSKQVDVQLGLEKLSTALLPALAGTNMVLGMGLVANENAFSLEALMIDHEITRYVARILEGIRFDGAVDLSVFQESGPGGHFLDRVHTVENFRREMWIPGILDREGLKPGDGPPSRGMRDRAREAIQLALERYSPPELPADIDSRLEAIIYG
jgi:trimethylamine--corrinoid protein Co-methyltransferase